MRSSTRKPQPGPLTGSRTRSDLACVQAEDARRECAGELETAQREHAAALHAVRQQSEEQMTLMRQAAEAAVTQTKELLVQQDRELDSLCMSRGHAQASLARVQAELSKLKGESNPTCSPQTPRASPQPQQGWYEGSRTRERRIMSLEKEVEAARLNEAELREQLEDARSTPAEREARRHKKASTLPAARLRTSDGSFGAAEAPLEARTLEHLRRLVVESNCSIQGAPTANALITQLQTGQQPPPERLFSRQTVRDAFMRLGVSDQLAEAAANAVSEAYWALSSDGGNKGRAIQMMAISMWNQLLNRPEVRPLGAYDLFSDQSAKNGSLTHMAAIETAGLKPELNVAGISDGTEHAVQEMAQTLVALHKQSDHEGAMLALGEFCCIHGKALEENCGMEAAFPGGYIVDGVRLLWEIIHSPEGARRGEYERIWADQCAFPAGLFDMSLGSVPEPTSSKWQVMYGVAEKLQPILEPVAHGQWKHADATSRPSYLEVFLDACRQLMCGSTDQERTGTVSHPHKEKIQTLTGIFRRLDVEAGLYLYLDVGNANYKSFYKFAKSPSR